MSVAVDVQRIIPGGPSDELIQRWLEQVLATENKDDAELTVRIVDETESAALNEEYRNKSNATNVLSFPFECPEEVELNLLGDLVICAPVVEREAKEQKKNSQAHWAHMIVHGVLAMIILKKPRLKRWKPGKLKLWKTLVFLTLISHNRIEKKIHYE